MKTQISRDSHQSQKRYSGVYQQQGRMITDADNNEFADITKEQLQAALEKAVATGVPAEKGLEIVDDGGIKVRPGFAVVNGVQALVLPKEGLDIDAAATPLAPMAYADQADFPSAPALKPNNYRLYLDVWERAVTGLEDQGLLDPALHGADTTTRTQVMAQVKWCASNKNPEDNNQNPSKGSVTATMQLRDNFAGGEDCNPCSDTVKIDEPVGNYLFRLEVHEVVGNPNNPTKVTFKWSRENASEQYRRLHPVDESVLNAPTGFDTQDWVYEFFTDESEKHLGVHLATGFTPSRGILKTQHVAPANTKTTYVRRWDGCCTFKRNGGNWELDTSQNTVNQDRETQIKNGLNANAHGHVNVTNAGIATLGLEWLELKLDLKNQLMVAGDYWLGLVRQDRDSAGDFVLGAAGQGILPQGVVHHYLSLARINGAGAIVAQNDAKRRQMNFPSLSNLNAKDIGLDNPCQHLFNNAENVHDALAELCNMTADDVRYVLPDCNGNTIKNLMATVANWPDKDGDGKTTVKDMLDSLLCNLTSARMPYDGAATQARWQDIREGAAGAPTTAQEAIDALVNEYDSTDMIHQVQNCGDAATPTVRSLMGVASGDAKVADLLNQLMCTLNAEHLPLDKTDAELCPELKQDHIKSTQDGLNWLCKRDIGSSACARTVGDGGHFATLDEAFKTLADEPSMSLCLLPGEHPVTQQPTFNKVKSIKISGAGAAASTVSSNLLTLTLNVDEIVFRDIAIEITNNRGVVELKATKIDVSGCAFERLGAKKNARPAIHLSNDKKGFIHWSNNHIRATYSETKAGTITDLVLPDGAVLAPGSAGRKAVEGLLAKDPIKDPVGYEKALSKAAKEVTDLPANKRKAWVRGRPVSLINAQPARVGRLLGLFGGGSVGPAFLFENSNRLREVNATMSARASANNFYTVLGASGVTAEKVRDALDIVIKGNTRTGFGDALAVADTDMGGSLNKSVFEGNIVFAADTDNPADLGTGTAFTSIFPDLEQPVIPDEVMRIEGCYINKMKFFMPKAIVGNNGRLGGQAPGYKSLFVTDNVFLQNNNGFIAYTLTMQGNHFEAADAANDLAGVVLGFAGTFTGNYAPHQQAKVTTVMGRKSASANLMTI